MTSSSTAIRTAAWEAETTSTDLSDQEAGLYLIHDLTELGSLATRSFDHAGPGSFDDKRVFYPAVLDDPTFLGSFPLVVISHGNGMNYAWYDFLQEHLASYGFIVMSHANNTFPGVETASTSTLQNTDGFLQDQGTMAGGVLDGHIDSSRISWIGHSRGGEGVVRAYDRIVDEGYPVTSYSANDLVFISSIAPTDFLGPSETDPHDTTYHLLVGGADGDVSGCFDTDPSDSFNVYERGTGKKSANYMHGAGHNHFNECGNGFPDATGPDQPGCEEVHKAQNALYVALLKHHVEGNVPAHDFLWRQYESIRPIGVLDTLVLDLEYKDGDAVSNFVIDDYQTRAALGTSSSGGTVTFDVLNLEEGRLDDSDRRFDLPLSDAFNGMMRTRQSDVQKGAVFDYRAGGSYFIDFEVIPSERDFSGKAYLSLRSCQITRHPETIAELADLTFSVTLTDGAGGSSSINFGAYGGGIEEPYQRRGCPDRSTVPGWQNEFETIRIRLTDFLTNDSGLDLTDVSTVRLEFGANHGSAQGRLGLDDVQVTWE